MTPVAKFGSVERALLALLVRDIPALEQSDARVGGDFPTIVDDFYIRIDKIGGRASTLEGDFVIDIDVFSADYARAEDIAQDIEALLLGSGILSVVADGRKWVFDEVYQNVGVDDRPWEGDDETTRMSATYALTARRSAASDTAGGSGPVIVEPDEPGGSTGTDEDTPAPIDPVLLFENALA